jgi:hypothetical protein
MAATILGLGASRIDPDTVAQRMAERDARQAADTRTDVQRFLGDPAGSKRAGTGFPTGTAPEFKRGGNGLICGDSDLSKN